MPNITQMNMLARKVLSELSGVDLTKCHRCYRDKYIRNYYWVVNDEGTKNKFMLTRDEAVVISAACHYNTTMLNYLLKLEMI